MKRIWHVGGKFAAATIVAVLQVKDRKRIRSKYIYWYIQHFKDSILVPLMRGAANVSLSLEKLQSLLIPVPPIDEQDRLISEMELIEADISRMRSRLQERIDDLAVAMGEFGESFAAEREVGDSPKQS